MDITQTKEAAVALAALITSGLKANEDKKITAFEAIGIVGGNVGALIAAVKGIGEIPTELKDLDPLEFEELQFTLIDALALENDNDARRKVGAVLDLLKQGLVTFRAFAAPRAEVVTDSTEPFPLP